MIRFSLKCASDHTFEAWFRSNADFDAQAERGLVTCPRCGATEVAKALMAPAVPKKGERKQIGAAMDPGRAEMIAKLRAFVKEVRGNSEDVGPRFAEEARKIHYGETDPRGIYGQASLDEARGLAEEGIEFAPLPDLPDDLN